MHKISTIVGSISYPVQKKKKITKKIEQEERKERIEKKRDKRYLINEEVI